jgi:hypothetical protein
MVQYTKKVDLVVYGDKSLEEADLGCPEDWLELALALLDQAGTPGELQDAVRVQTKKIIDDMNDPRNWSLSDND